MSRSEIMALFELFIEYVSEEGEPISASIKSNLKAVANLIPFDVNAEKFVFEFATIFENIEKLHPEMPKGSLRARRSTAAAVARWAYHQRIVPFSQCSVEYLRMPPTIAFADWMEAPKALTAYKALLAEMSIAGIAKDDLDEHFITRFFERIPDYMKDWRGGWRAFRKRWLELVEEGELPDIDLPTAPNKKPESYKMHLSELPLHLQQELKIVRDRLLGRVLEERLGRPLDNSTVDLQIGTVLRLMGFLHRETSCNLSSISLRDGLSLENAKALVRFTNSRWCERNDVASGEVNTGIGAYEYGQLLHLATVVHVGLRDDILAAKYAEECRFSKKLVQERREASKHFGSVDDYLGIACNLIEQCRATGTDCSRSITRATLLRDALMFALLAVFADRLSVFTALTLGEHIREGKSGAVLICIPREQTKPSIRDLVRELPSELSGLWREYLDWARPTLLARKRDHGRLWVGQGGSALSSNAIYATFEKRCFDHLGLHHNPHQTRKALATNYGEWSGGDYLTISAVLDSSWLTIQKYYADLQQEGKIRKFDETTCDPWNKSTEEMT